MKCDFCKKAMRHPKIVHSASGAFHPVCLDKLHAAAGGVAELMGSVIAWQTMGRPSDMECIMEAMRGHAKPIGEYLKQLASNARAQEEKAGRGKA